MEFVIGALVLLLVGTAGGSYLGYRYGKKAKNIVEGVSKEIKS